MPTINASKYGSITATSTTSWAGVRDGSTGIFVTNQPSGNQFAAKISFVSGGKGSEWGLIRSYYAFDVTSYQTGFTITNLKFNFDSSNLTSTNFGYAIIKSTAQGNANSNLSTSSWDDIDFSTLYADGSESYWPDNNNVNNITLNSAAVSAFSTGYLKIAVVSYADYSDDEPSVSGLSESARYNASYTPRITFNATAAGYDNIVTGVEGADIGTVIGVEAADIGTVIGVE